MAQRLKGRPLGEIKAELVRYYGDGEISDPELTEYAEIQEGTSISFEYGGLKD